MQRSVVLPAALALLCMALIGGAVDISTLTITDVGGEGCYPDVTNMEPGTWPTCTQGAAACHQQATFRSASLAPFDEELTLVFRGPMELSNLAVYYPGGPSSAWTRESYWTPDTTSNLVWFNNRGGGESGVFTICGGNSQSYASANGSLAAASPQQFSGSLANEDSINALTAQACSGTACGPFFRPESNHGWAGPSGGAKAFVVRLSMPDYTGPAGGFYSNAPAFWILNAKIVHTAQFGCNCRGTGPKGCGEFDVLEVLPDGDLGVATSTIYSFRGAIGGGSNAFARPASPTTYAVIFDPTQGLGRVQVTILDESFTFPSSVAKPTIDEWNARVGFNMSMANRVPSPNPYPCPAGPSSAASRLTPLRF